jgi:DNA-binding transcriptional ArsR family regulator|tara:strand:+ start:388 stop:753 length:366 start_codon:yes stop_codon:yes gene_type:complete
MENLDQTFSALSDPTRRAILARLAMGEASVGELAGPFDISLPAVSRHLKVLESAHLIEREKDAQFRRCRLNAGPLRDAADWISRYKEFWEDQLGALADYLNEMKEVDRGDKAKTGKDSKQD